MKKNIKKKHFYAIFILLLISSSIVGCQWLRDNQTEKSGSKEVTENNPDLSNSFKKINDALENFIQDKEDFIKSLEYGVQYNNDPEKLKKISSDALSNSFDSLNTAIKNKPSIELSTIEQNRLITLENSINTTISKIKEIIIPAKDGLTEEAIKEIQDVIYPSSSSEEYGKFDEKTKNEIVNILNGTTNAPSLVSQTKKLVDIYSQNTETAEGESSTDKDELAKTENRTISEQETLALKQQIIQDIKETYTLRGLFLPGFVSGFLGGILSFLSLIMLELGYNKLAKNQKKPSSKKHLKALSQQSTASSSTPVQSHQPATNVSNYDYSRYLQEISQLKSDNNELNRELFKVTEQINHLTRRLQIIEKNKSSKTLSYESNSGLYTPQQDYTPQPVRQSRPTPPPSYETKPHSIVPSPPSNYSTPRLVQTYNRDAKSLLRNVTEVSETQESFSNRSVGKSTTVILESKNKGIYAVIEEGNTNYLIPSRYFTITKNNYQTVEYLFECRGYQPSYSKDFELVKPAVVIPLSGNQWQLQERGILEF